MSGSSLGIAFVKTFSSHYPERLGSIQLIDPPGVFQILLKAVGAVMDERTASKLASVTGASHAERMALLEERIGAGDAMQWLAQVLDSPVDVPLPPMPSGYFAVADTTPTPAQASPGPGGAGAQSPEGGAASPASTGDSASHGAQLTQGPRPGMPAWTVGIKSAVDSGEQAASAQVDAAAEPPLPAEQGGAQVPSEDVGSS